VEKTKHKYVLPKWIKCNIITISFVSWTFQGTHDIFVFVIKRLKVDWQPKQVIIDLFEATKLLVDL